MQRKELINIGRKRHPNSTMFNPCFFFSHHWQARMEKRKVNLSTNRGPALKAVAPCINSSVNYCLIRTRVSNASLKTTQITWYCILLRIYKRSFLLRYRMTLFDQSFKGFKDMWIKSLNNFYSLLFFCCFHLPNIHCLRKKCVV